ncbi:MAG TPA: hypothetical protein VGN74_12545 [Brevundimonas sp.]|jgi:hypothetical protein|uniref:hypothetical protein n=1 Tax=Brevundimonas sp. TaxID=1871086 RepID=UPI002E101779|nr:hypothetical protein [Brevundimonas sp.]
MTLQEPEVGAGLIAADRALAEAVRNRLAQPAAAPDVETLALRHALQGLDGPARAALKAVAGRLAATRRPVTVAGPASQLLAADRYGGTRNVATTAEAALTAPDPATVLIDLDGLGPWWARLLARADRAVIGALPDEPGSRPLALQVGAAMTGPTGDDRTFWVTDAAASEAAIVAVLAGEGLIATPAARAGGLKLFLLTGYVQPHDARLEAPAVATLGRLSGVIGHAPVL